MKRLINKKYLPVCVIVIILSMLFSGCKIQSKKDYYDKKLDLTDKDTVSITIRCDTILDNMDKLDKSLKDIIPKDGIILEKTQVAVEADETVLDILQKVAKQKELVINTSGSKAITYIIGINGIKEFNCGELSGWNFKVNGEKLGVSCGAAKITKGDEIEILYTCDLGNDLD